MIKIQEGCNQVCAYCIVPKVRGRERSIPPDVLLGQVRQRISEGYKEVTLTGTQLGSYGFDLAGSDLKYLVGLILKETGIDRLRISSLQPQEITPDLLELWEDSRLCAHFHIPLQSGSDYILGRMRRRYTTTQYAEAVDRVRARVPDVSITADVIVGFPGEDDRHHQESLSFAHKMGLAAMHVFPYSLRPGTGAAHMGPQVDGRTKSGRMEEMLALAKEQASFFRSRFIGTARQVLWERSDIRRGKPVYLGLTDNYLKVHTEESSIVSNQITFARLVSEEGGSLLARGV
jgi:threonylcarbamoyladenosine tRNA methylthiotransferase MtaB